MTAPDGPARRAGAIGLLAALALLAAGVAPGAARAASCPAEGPLQAYQRAPVAFVGQVVERRGSTVVLSVESSFKGVAADAVVELVDDDGAFARPAPAPQDGDPSPPQYGVLAAPGADGRLHTGTCRILSPLDLGDAFRANREGRTCAGPPPRIVRVAPRRGEGRLLRLRIVVADGRERAHGVDVRWGGEAARGYAAVTPKRVPASRTIVLRHRYASRGDGRQGTVTIRMTVAARPPLLCGGEMPSSSRTLRVRI